MKEVKAKCFAPSECGFCCLWWVVVRAELRSTGQALSMLGKCSIAGLDPQLCFVLVMNSIKYD